MINTLLITLAALSLAWLVREISRRPRFDARIRARDWTHYRER